MIDTRWEDLMAILNVLLRPSATAPPVLGRAKAKSRVGVSAPPITEIDTNS